MPDDVADLLRRILETQDVMFRRQIATEQLFRDIKNELATWREQAVQAAKHSEEIAVLKYQVAQFAAIQDRHGVRLSILLPSILIILAVLAVALILSFAR